MNHLLLAYVRVEEKRLHPGQVIGVWTAHCRAIFVRQALYGRAAYVKENNKKQGSYMLSVRLTQFPSLNSTYFSSFPVRALIFS